MGKIFTLDADTKSVIQDVLDDFLINVKDGGLAKTCLIVYPPKVVRCVNCVYDPTTNRSSNRPRSGCPQPFAMGGTCPLCSGKGMREDAVTEEISLKCTWEFKKFTNPPADIKIRVPNSLVETKGYITDLPKLLKAQHIVVNLPIAPFLRQEYTLYGEPGDPSNMVPGRYFYAVWERKK